MSVTLENAVVLPEPRIAVWPRLNDPEMLMKCVPGAQSVTPEGEGFAVVARVKVGPVKATFRGRVALAEIEPNRRYRIEGRGDGGVAGFAKGAADVLLEDHPEGCLLTYTAEAQIGGRLAQLGSRLVGGIAARNADQFFESFLAELSRARIGA